MKTLSICMMILFFNRSYSQTAETRFRELVSNVILLEKKVGNNLVPHGTGTLFYNYTNPKTVIVVTNKHILLNNEIFLVIYLGKAFKHALEKDKVNYININRQVWKKAGNTLILEYPLIKDSTFVIHDSLDIAAFPIYMPSYFYKDSVSSSFSIINVIPKSSIKFKNSQIVTNDVFFVGFPLGIGTPSGLKAMENNVLKQFYKVEVPLPLVRSGIISWLSDYSKEFLLDAISLGGNSGSPVYTDINGRLFYIGIVFSHWSFDNENIGLVRCYWSDEVLKVVEKTSKLNY